MAVEDTGELEGEGEINDVSMSVEILIMFKRRIKQNKTSLQ